MRTFMAVRWNTQAISLAWALALALPFHYYQHKMQRVTVRIELDKDQLKTHPLRIGLSIDAKVDTSDSSGKLLADVSRTTPVSTTAQMNAQVAEADSLVKDIISKNIGNASETNAIEKAASASNHGAKSHVTKS